MEFEEHVYQGVRVWQIQRWVARGLIHGFVGNDLDCRVPGAALPQSLSGERHLHFLKQVHGIEIVGLAEARPDVVPEGDAWFVQREFAQQRLAGIKTADCIPVLVIGGEKFCAAVHCGWRSATDGLLPRVIERLCAAGVIAEEMEVALGPGAGVCCYEVGDEVITAVENALAKLPERMKAGHQAIVKREFSRFADLRALLAAQLAASGVKSENVAESKLCTICDGRFFSHRRQGNESGRQVSFVG